MPIEVTPEPGEALASALGWHYEEERALNVGPAMRLTVDGADLSAADFGRLLTALDELWVACADGDPEARLRIVELGMGSLWARIVAECKKSPIATFAAFMSLFNASSAGPTPPVPPAPPPIVQKAYENFSQAREAIERKGGYVHIDMEIGPHGGSSENPFRYRIDALGGYDRIHDITMPPSPEEKKDRDEDTK